MFLQTYGVTDALCLRLVRKYGNSAKLFLRGALSDNQEVKGIGLKQQIKLPKFGSSE